MLCWPCPCVLPASAETLTGAARIIDAGTVEIAGEMLRLEGIDADQAEVFVPVDVRHITLREEPLKRLMD